MAPLDIFNEAWIRCGHLSVIHAYVAANVTSAIKPDEILRAEWAARVSALDLYIHELIAQNILEILAGNRSQPNGFSKFQVDASYLLLQKTDPSYLSQMDLQIREKLERKTFQLPEDIADGVRYVSNVELWNEVALTNGSTEANKHNDGKNIKKQLAAIVQRRNKIVHEADLQPGTPRLLWPISVADLQVVKDFIEKTVNNIDCII